MLTIVLGVALKAFKTQDMSEAVYVVIGFKCKLPSVVNTLQILLTQMCLSSANQNLLFGTPLLSGGLPKNKLNMVGWLGMQSQLVKVEGSRSSCTNKSLPWTQAGTEMVNNSHSCAATVWKGKSVQGCFADKLVLLPERLGFILPALISWMFADLCLVGWD